MQRTQHRQQVFRALTGVSAVALVPISVYALFASGIWFGMITVGAALIFATMFAYARKSNRLIAMAHVMIAFITSVIWLLSMHRGGLVSVTLGWMPLVILLASLMTGPRGAAVWTVLLNGIYLALWSDSRSAGWDHSLGSPENYLILRLFSLWGTLALTWAYERSIGSALDETGRALEVRDAFIGNMSHEIRTPINAVMGLSRMLASTALNGQQREYNRLILESSDHLLRLVNQNLDLSKLHAQQLELEDLIFSPAELVRTSAALLRSQAEEKGLVLRHEIDAQVTPWVHGDPGRLRQVLLNLIGNAIKFTPQGQVTVQLMPENGGLRFSVQDSGVGIDPAVIPRLFQAFTQADSSTTRRYGGTGLGLTISQALIQQMGGEIQVESTPTKGATFWFHLTLPPASAPTDVPSSALTFRGGRILVAEDNQINQRITRFSLEKLGLEVHMVDNGAQAVERSRTERYDLILMDCYMPVMDGFQAASQISSQIPHPPPIVALSASALDEDRRRCMAAGMQGFIGKPIDPQRLQTELGRLLPDLIQLT
ncbi:MAG: ATP-binding protein [Myxococcota bacterium]